MKRISTSIIILTLFLCSCNYLNITIETSNILSSTPVISTTNSPIVTATPGNSAMEAYKAVLNGVVR